MKYLMSTFGKKGIRLAAGLGVMVLILAACSSTPAAPSSSLNAARDAITNAEQRDARQYAGAELDEAKQELLKAERAVEAERMEAAEMAAERARVTAELAIARTEAAKAEAINKEMARGAEALIEEMQRSGDSQ